MVGGDFDSRGELKKREGRGGSVAGWRRGRARAEAADEAAALGEDGLQGSVEDCADGPFEAREC
jgi:hypothetical protein